MTMDIPETRSTSSFHLYDIYIWVWLPPFLIFQWIKTTCQFYVTWIVMVNKTTPNPQGSFSCWWSSWCSRWWGRCSQQRWGSTAAPPGRWTRRRSGSPDTAVHTHSLLQGCQVNQGTQIIKHQMNTYLCICANLKANTIQHTVRPRRFGTILYSKLLYILGQDFLVI